MPLLRIALLAALLAALAGPAGGAAPVPAVAPTPHELEVAGAAPPTAAPQTAIPRGLLGRRGIERIKASVAFAATALLALSYALERRSSISSLAKQYRFHTKQQS